MWYIDDLILRDRSVSGGTLNERLYALQDANWNVTAVADATGAVQEPCEYDPYGVTTILAPDLAIRAASNFGWETTYCGYRWDAGTGLFAVRHRFYHPQMGVWLTRDPKAYTSALSLYLYDWCLIATDPYGELAWLAGSLPAGPVGWVVVGVLVFVIVGAAYVAYRRRNPSQPPSNPMSPDQRGQIDALCSKLFVCAQKSGLNSLAANLQSVQLGRVYTPAGAETIDANANTVGQTTNFAPVFFNFSTCRKYETLIHEAGRVGGNYAEERNPQALAWISQEEDQMFRKMAACLGCCDEFPKANRPEDCEAKQTACNGNEQRPTSGTHNVCPTPSPQPAGAPRPADTSPTGCV
ncbi:MAG: hypothetical protein KatS3mg114_0169 [Planctomycetaceae bacterium]|nr:MAG: hypothetical protein KatS3mg114_0169 [Planctomycetaceae bacterium]